MFKSNEHREARGGPVQADVSFVFRTTSNVSYGDVDITPYRILCVFYSILCVLTVHLIVFYSTPYRILQYTISYFTVLRIVFYSTPYRILQHTVSYYMRILCVFYSIELPPYDTSLHETVEQGRVAHKLLGP